MLRVGVCQLNLTVGDLDGNVERMLAALAEVSGRGGDVAVFPELAVCGYPPEDLLAKPRFAQDCQAALEKLAAAGDRCAAVVGLPSADADGTLYNAAAVCANGAVVGTARKAHLPNYGVFDEKRHFTAGAPEALFEIAGTAVGISICEDIWIDGGAVERLAAGGAELIVNLNASPYCVGKLDERLAVLRRRIDRIRRPVVYVNLVGGQDELVFDGRSLVLDAEGAVLAQAAAFAEEVLLVDVALEAAGPVPAAAPLARLWVNDPAAAGPQALPPPALPAPLHPLDEVYEALVAATRDYVTKNGFSDVCLGLSGGVDSSLVAVIAADALGPGRVHGVMMPSRFSSEHSLADAEALSENLGIEARRIGIEPAHRAFEEMLAPAFAGLPPGLAEENVQSRVRAVVLMALANKFDWLLLATGNKSEAAVGYSTLYGDSAGAFAPIADVWKTQVYALARRRNEAAGRPLIPQRVLEKAPSAELRPDQRDSDSLPPYETLDQIARALVEGDKTVAELIAAEADPDLVRRLGRLLDAAEYKRRQGPPRARVTSKAFGRDRRIPITNRYRGEARD
ncbi:MAG: NAD+ synthase [bacterium]|nr:NAD+ synthase [bacterium]MXZ31232.1 NAD+ synthase [Acidimicrobiia bacterium]MYJ13729.1 NAD+ synthase [Acidimicrobiia bacterium]